MLLGGRGGPLRDADCSQVWAEAGEGAGQSSLDTGMDTPPASCCRHVTSRVWAHVSSHLPQLAATQAAGHGCLLHATGEC